jgi:hypothetical protein
VKNTAPNATRITMQRLSIRTLMAFVLVSAVGLAALRNASDLRAGMMMLVALAAVGVAVLGAIFLRSPQRVWWTGFAIFSGGYLVFALVPWLSLQLGTTHVLDYVHAQVVSSSILTFEVSRFDQSSVVYRIVSPDGGVHVSMVADNVANSTTGSDFLASIAPVNRWRSALPGAANHDAFDRVGHSRFALLAGLVGGTIAVWFYARRVRSSVTE